METDEIKNPIAFGNFEASVDTSFFYTSDRIISSLDDRMIVEIMLKKYPEFHWNNKDIIVKKAFLLILNDKDLIKGILDKFGLNIFDLFKIIHKYYSSIFTPIYIKKVKEILRHKRYSKAVK